jgi:hypothetical protein
MSVFKIPYVKRIRRRLGRRRVRRVIMAWVVIAASVLVAGYLVMRYDRCPWIQEQFFTPE